MGDRLLDQLLAEERLRAQRLAALARAAQQGQSGAPTGQPTATPVQARGQGEGAASPPAGAPAGNLAPADIQRLRHEALLRALRAAHEAGDTAAAQRLARMAREAQQGGQVGQPGDSPPDYAALLRRLDEASGPGFQGPGYSGPANLDANRFGGPDPAMGERMGALLTPEGQAARRAQEGLPAPAPSALPAGDLVALAAAARGSWSPERRAAEIQAHSRPVARVPGLLERMGLTPGQMGEALRENLLGDEDPTTLNRGERLAAALNLGGEALTLGLMGDEAAGWFDANVLRRGQGTAEERTAFHRGQEAQLWDQHPGTALAATLGGGLLGPGLGAARVIDKGVGLLSRLGRGAAVGGLTGAVYGAADAESDMLPAGQESTGGWQDRALGGLLGAGVGGVGGAAITGIGQGFIRAAQALRGTAGGGEVAASVAGLKDAAQGLYRAADDAGVVLPQARLAQLAADATEALRSAGYNARLHPRLRAVLGELKDVAKGDQSLGRLEIARRVAGNAAESMQPDERRLAGVVIDKIDDMIAGLGDDSAALRGARELWARMSRLGRIEQIMENASNVGPNSSLETALANGFRAFLRNPRNLRGFSDAEKRLMQQIARGSAGVKALRGLAELLSPFGAPGVGAVAGALYTGNPVAAVLSPLAGLASRAGSNALVRGQATGLQRMVGQDDAQRAALDALLRQPNAMAPLAAAPTPMGLLDYLGTQ